jgi:glycerophosphoryl diester phosphodiesterase
MKLPFIVTPPFRIIAHRGASAYAPENTLSAFQLAVAMGIKEIELDVQLSLDGQVVICHDLSLERYGYPVLVESTSWAELDVLDMGSWFSPFLYSNERMLRLEDLFKRYGRRVTYHIEIKGKSEELPQRVCRLIDRFGLQEQVIITGFSYEALQRIRRLAPGLRLGWLVQNLDRDTLSQSHELELFQLCPKADSITFHDVRLAQAEVPEIRVWGVEGRRGEVLRLIQKTIDARCDGATLNWPDWVSYPV